MFNVRKRRGFERFLSFFIVYVEYFTYLCGITLKAYIMLLIFELEILMKMHFGALLQLSQSATDVLIEQQNIYGVAVKMNDVESMDYSSEVIERAEANLMLLNMAMEHLEDENIVNTEIATFSLN